MKLRYPARLNFLFVVALIASLASTATSTSSASAHDECTAILWTDTPTDNQTVAGTVRFAGWALDTKEASFSSGIESVQLFLDGEAGAGGRLIGQATMGNKDATTTRPDLVRSDVDIAYSRSNNRAGWVLDVDLSGFTVGRHTVYVYAETHCGWTFVRFNINVDPAAPIVAQPVTTSGAPYFSTGSGSLLVRIDSPSAGSDVTGTARISGVAANCGTGSPTPGRVRIYEGSDASGRLLGDATLSGRDLAAVCSGRTGMAEVAFTYSLNTRRLSDNNTLTIAVVADWGNGVTATGTTTLYVRNYDRDRSYQGYGGYANPVAYGNCMQYDYRGQCISYSNAYGNNTYNNGLYCPAGTYSIGAYPGAGTVFAGGNTYYNGAIVNSPYTYSNNTFLNQIYGANYGGLGANCLSYVGGVCTGYSGSSLYGNYGLYGNLGAFGASCLQYIGGVCSSYANSGYAGYYGGLGAVNPYCSPLLTNPIVIAPTALAPTNATATPASATTAVVTWTPPIMTVGTTLVVSGYQVERAPVVGAVTGTFLIAATVSGATVNNTVISGLTTATTNAFRVRTLFSNGSLSEPSNVAIALQP